MSISGPFCFLPISVDHFTSHAVPFGVCILQFQFKVDGAKTFTLSVERSYYFYIGLEKF